MLNALTKQSMSNFPYLQLLSPRLPLKKIQIYYRYSEKNTVNKVENNLMTESPIVAIKSFSIATRYKQKLM